MIKCPGCSIELIRLPALFEGVKKELWIHPENPFKKCDYAVDGTRVTTEVIDPLLCSKFQELIEKEGVRGPNVQVELVSAETNESLIKKRLAKGELNIKDFLEIKELIR